MNTGRRSLLAAAGLACAASACGATTSTSDTLCHSGKRQSPIDIPDVRPQPGPALRPDYQAATPRIAHDGHTVRVRFAPGQRLWLGGQALTLQQFHFHMPGGDHLHGEEFPLGMHFLHKDAAGRLVALVVLFRQGAEHPALAALLPHMPAQGQPERALAGWRVNPGDWLPASHAYYRYEGSLTAAPCTEGVLWLVMQEPLQASAAQLAGLARLFGPNARPVQALHGRVVTLTP